ncbi:MAG: hypothetical protein EPO25_03535 [Gammaproteobacteria bacterium]|nr:MAG: hypothetical protein EPO25_03535 [Gammaproteobacteria bacterium]
MLILALLAGPAGSAERDPEGQLREVRQRIERLQRAVRQDTGRRDALSAQLRDAEESLRAASSSHAAARARLAASDQRLGALRIQREQSERELLEQRELLAAQLRTAYMIGPRDQLRLLLGQQDPVALGRVLVYYSYLGRARAGQIAGIEVAVLKLDQATAQEAAERDRLAALEAEASRELAALDAARAGRTRALQAMNAQIRSNSDTIAKLRRDAAALEKLIADLRRALRDLPPAGGQAFAKVRGRLAWPVAGRIVARYGQSRGGGLRWNGVMIEAARGSEIRSLYEGRVAYADWLPGLGLLLIIDHGGYLSLYGHNDQLYKAAGDRVEGGEVVATVGDSGGRSQPGLYLEIRRGAQPVDPVPWFRRSSP